MIAAISTTELVLWLSLATLCVALSGIYSGAETGMYCVNMTRLRLATHTGSSAAARLQRLMRDRAAFLFTTLFGTNLANYIAPLCVTIIFVKALEGRSRHEAERLAEIYTTLILTPIVFVLGEAVPKNVFHRNADRLMLAFSPMLEWSHRVSRLLGITMIERVFSEWVLRALRRSTPGSPLHPRRDVYQMLREGAAEGTLTLTQAAILERIDRLRLLQVSTVMVPFRQIVMLDASATRKSAESLIRDSRVSRFPVHAGDRRRIVGLVHVLDLATAGGERTARELMRPVAEIPPDMRVVDALSKLQREFRRMAIIVDQRGRCLGIVTVKDLVEEIVGELKAW